MKNSSVKKGAEMYNDSFRIRYGIAPIAISENRDHYDTAPHIHNEIELLRLKAGEATVTVSDRSYRMKAGDIVVVNPMEVHSVIADRRYPYHQECICFDLSLLPDKELVCELTSGESYIYALHTLEEEVTGRLCESFDRLFEAVKQNRDTLLFESTAYVCLMLAALKEHGEVKSRGAKGKRASFPRKVQEYLADHYTEDITSDDAARELFYTQSYFCRLFREEFGTSFLEYLAMYRISIAKSMLKDPAVKISSVAEKIGFFDSSYFSRCFRRFVGMSPTEYKKHQYS